MDERYQKLFTLQNIYYNDNCPVLVHDGAITKDNERGNIFLQLKMENFSAQQKNIKASTVIFNFFDAFGKEVISNFEYNYLDLDCKMGDIFGNKTPVYINDQSVRSFTFTVSKVLFSDGSEWQSEGFEWSVYPIQKKLEDAGFDSQQIRQLKSETQNRAEFAYTGFDKLWFCVCGKVNCASEEKCSACCLGRDYLEAVTPEYLRSNAIYADAMANMTAGKYSEAIRLFGFIKGWRDADENIHQCEEKIKAKSKKKKKRRIGCLTSFVSITVALILFITVGIPAIAYGIGNNNLKKGEYESASIVFAFLGGMDYKDSCEKFAESSLGYIKYVVPTMDNATIEFELASLFDYAWNDILDRDVMLETAYNWAVEQSQAGDYYYSSYIFDCLDDYRDSAEKMAQCNNALISSAEPGSYIRFGTLEQTSLFDSEELIDWKVLARSDNMILVVAERALLKKAFSVDSKEVTWQDSNMRKYLNGDFINEVFTAEEQNRILSVVLDDNFTHAGTNYSAPSTQDRVFLLSYNEVATYFSDAKDAKCIISNVASGSDDNSEIFYASYTLRSPGFVVNYNGEVEKWASVFNKDFYVRPAMWISVN